MPRSERQEQQQNKSPMKEKQQPNLAGAPRSTFPSDRYLHKEISH
jgi:hypothetical protein